MKKSGVPPMNRTPLFLFVSQAKINPLLCRGRADLQI
jgi:hypothetical protein